MAYPVNGLKGKITSWGTTGDDVYQLINSAIRPVEVTINVNSNTWDGTPLDGDNTALEFYGGLMEGTVSFRALYPKTAPVLGNTGLLTLASTTTPFCKGWTLRGAWPEVDITDQPSAPVSKRFMPGGLLDWGGTFIVRQSSGAALSLPTAANGAGEAATFKIKETTTADVGFTGNVVIDAYSQTVNPRNAIEATYNYRGTGSLTSVEGTTGGPAILPAGVLAMPDWDNDGDGVPDVELVVQLFTGRTLTAKAFLREFEVTCMVGEPVSITGTARISDAIVLA